MSPRIGAVPLDVTGLVMKIEWALEFAAWAERHRFTPSWMEVSRRWDCSRATAYRYIAVWQQLRNKRADDAHSTIEGETP